MDIPVLKDCWLVGDEFLGSIYNELQTWKNEQASDNKPLPYLYTQYNMSSWYRSPLSPHSNGVRLLNSFIDGLNSTPKLPKYVLVFPDRDLITGLKFLDFCVILLLDEHVSWLFRKLNKEIKRRRDDLMAKRPGALASSFKPRLIFIMMLERPPMKSIKEKKIMGLKDRFNSMLMEAVAAERYMYILDIELNVHNIQYFNYEGNLTTAGMREFWADVNRQMRLFDCHDIELTIQELREKIDRKKSVLKSSKFISDHRSHGSRDQCSHRR